MRKKSVISIVIIVLGLMAAFVGNFIYKSELGQSDNLDNSVVENAGMQGTGAQSTVNEKDVEFLEVVEISDGGAPSAESYCETATMSRNTFFTYQVGEMRDEVFFAQSCNLINTDFTRCRCSVQVNDFEINEDGDFVVDFIITSYNDESVVLNWNTAYSLKYLDAEGRFPEEVSDVKDDDLYNYYKSGNVVNLEEVQFVKRATMEINEHRYTDEYGDMCELKPGKNRFVLLYKRPEGFAEQAGYRWCLTNIGTTAACNKPNSFFNNNFIIMME